MNRVRGCTMPFQWTVNPFRGCEIGCFYCYARPTHEYLGHSEPLAFEERIYVKGADPGTLLHRLAGARRRGEEIALGTATDPYQPAETRFRVTRRVLESIRRVPGLRVSITTKSALIVRDLDLLRAIAGAARLRVNISLISLDADVLRVIEPRAPRPDLRLGAMDRLARAGIETDLFVMPILPLISDGEEALRALLQAARRSGARRVAWKVLFLRGTTRGHFLGLLAREFPAALPAYGALYRDGASASGGYRREVEHLMGRLAVETGFSSKDCVGPVRQAPGPRQLALHW